MSTVIDEGTILHSLRQVPTDRWGEVLRFLETLIDAEPPISTGADLIKSGLAGMWADRDDIGSRQESADTSQPPVHTGADLVTFWRAEGLVGSRPDITDSQAYARELREQAQRRRS